MTQITMPRLSDSAQLLADIRRLLEQPLRMEL